MGRRWALLPSGSSLKTLYLAEMGFPRYIPDEFYRRLADPHYPVMMVHGEWDLATPLKYAKQVHTQRPHWYFEPLPLLGHSSTAVQAIGIKCVMQHIVRFMDDPGTNPYKKPFCAEQLPPLDWQGVSPQVAAVAATYFGTSSLYGPDREDEAGVCTWHGRSQAAPWGGIPVAWTTEVQQQLEREVLPCRSPPRFPMPPLLTCLPFSLTHPSPSPLPVPLPLLLPLPFPPPPPPHLHLPLPLPPPFA